MAETLEKLIENLQAEINILRAQVSSGRPTAPRLVPNFPYTQVVRDRNLTYCEGVFLSQWSHQP